VNPFISSGLAIGFNLHRTLDYNDRILAAHALQRDDPLRAIELEERRISDVLERNDATTSGTWATQISAIR
jgi:hypothetical protein